MDPLSIIEQALSETNLSHDESFRQLLRHAAPAALRAIKQLCRDDAPANPREPMPQLPAAPPPRGTPEYDQVAGIPAFYIEV